MSRRRFLSEAECQDIAQRLAKFTQGGGDTSVVIVSEWSGNVRWARNQVSTSGDVRNDHVVVNRNLRGAKSGVVHTNVTTDSALLAATRRAERLAHLHAETPEYDRAVRYKPEPFTAPQLFSEATYQLDSSHRSALARQLAKSAADAGMLSAGYIEVGARSIAQINSMGFSRYFEYTSAQYSVTVRDPQGLGSGWAGVDQHDWARIDSAKLSAMALDKCLQSRNPVRIEPGRYTTILEPQAVCDFVAPLMNYMDRWNATNGGNEQNPTFPFGKVKSPASEEFGGLSKLGDKVMDERITIGADPMDPDLGFPPFRVMQNLLDTSDMTNDVYHPATWITNGTLTQLEYPLDYGVRALGQSKGLPNSGAFRMSVKGPQTSIDEMITTTRRGVLVTRFVGVFLIDSPSLLHRGYTRDGMWLIENGRITKPVKNMIFTESILAALNNVEQLGTPQRAFHPNTIWWWWNPKPVIVPPLKIRDFSFTALSDAV